MTNTSSFDHSESEGENLSLKIIPKIKDRLCEKDEKFRIIAKRITNNLKIIKLWLTKFQKIV